MDERYRFSLICPRCKHRNDDLLATETRTRIFETMCLMCDLQFSTGKSAMDNLVRTIELGMPPVSPYSEYVIDGVIYRSDL